VRQLGVTLLDGMSIAPDLPGERDKSAAMAPATPAFRLIRIETKDSTRSTERKPNPLLGDAFAMVTGGGTLPVMGSAVMGLPTLRLPATGLRSNQAF
jgi:hypothetical protein